MVKVRRAVPKAGLSIAPHSPFAAGFIRTQSGTKLRLASFHVRLVLATIELEGARSRPNAPPTACAVKYLFRLAFSAVLPLPKTSNDKPVLGAMVCQRTPSAAGNTIFRSGANSPGPTRVSGYEMCR